MPDAYETIVPMTKPKRARKPSKPRVPRVKDEAILAIEAQAKAAKDEYRKSQASGGVLKRIVDKMLPRLTKEDRSGLLLHLDLTEKPPIKTQDSVSSAIQDAAK